jgi:hypothetical protein
LTKAQRLVFSWNYLERDAQRRSQSLQEERFAREENAAGRAAEHRQHVAGLVYADSAYRSAETEAKLDGRGFEPHP